MGLTAIMLSLDGGGDAAPVMSGTAPLNDAQLREADALGPDVVQHYWGAKSDDFVAPVFEGRPRSSMGEAPSWVEQSPTADTILCCLRLLCSAFSRTDRARGLFIDATGVQPLLRVLVHYGQLLRPDTPADDSNVQCFVGSLMCYAWLTARPHAFEIAIAPFHAACAQAGVTEAGSAAAAVVTIALTCALGLVDVPRFLVRCVPSSCGHASFGS
jgi:hypothetical protein